jgi:hypothetical protein
LRKSGPGPGFWVALVAIGFAQFAWLGWFLAEPLPNAGNVGGNGLARINLLVRAVPEVVPDLKFHQSYLGLALAELSHVENLRQRVPIVLAAGLIAASAIGLGNLILRWLKLREPLGVWERAGDDRARDLDAARWSAGTAPTLVDLGGAGRPDRGRSGRDGPGSSGG